MAVMYLVNATGTLRVSEEGERYGLDLHEHGISAYPEYVISALGTPGGMSQSRAETGPLTDRVLTAPRGTLDKAFREARLSFHRSAELVARRAGGDHP